MLEEKLEELKQKLENTQTLYYNETVKVNNYNEDNYRILEFINAFILKNSATAKRKHDDEKIFKSLSADDQRSIRESIDFDLGY